MADDWNAQLDAKQLLLDERIAEQNRTVILDGVQRTVSATRRSSERAFVHELRTLGSSTGPLPSDCPAGCLVRDSDLTVNLADTATAAALFCKAGICVFNDVLPCGLIEECRGSFTSAAALVDAALAARHMGADGVYVGHEIAFNEVCQRGKERLDIRGVGMTDGPLASSALHIDAPWMPFVKAVLGEEAHECFRGVVDNRPGSGDQEWHADGVHTDYERTTTCEQWHAQSSAAQGEGREEEAPQRLTLFIPLVDLDDPGCGATQFFPGSHTHATANLYRHLAPYDCETQPLFCTPRPSRGGMIAFDYRLVHRGTSNERPRGGATRPILYIVYAVCGIDDEDNFPSDAPLFASDVSPV